MAKNNSSSGSKRKVIRISGFRARSQSKSGRNILRLRRRAKRRVLVRS